MKNSYKIAAAVLITVFLIVLLVPGVATAVEAGLLRFLANLGG